VSLPKPLPGLVIRYSYLWANDAALGREEGDKERPASVVMVTDIAGSAAVRVYVLPITHAMPAAGIEAIEIPAVVCKSAGLDSARSWVLLSEFNVFVWPGYDLAVIPNRTPATIAYGFLSAGFFAKVRERWLALDAVNASRLVSRDAAPLPLTATGTRFL
jgi:hypothetical protein